MANVKKVPIDPAKKLEINVVSQSPHVVGPFCPPSCRARSTGAERLVVPTEIGPGMAKLDRTLASLPDHFAEASA